MMEDAKYKVLLIEDDEIDQMAFKRMAEQNDLLYDCVMAGSVSEAQNILRSERFDIIIADYSLGDGTAFDVLDSVKNTPVVFVTGAGNEEVATRAWKAGSYDYIVKDHERNYLKTLPITVENAIRHKRMEDRLRLLSHAIVSTDDSVYITDLDDRIIFVNKAFCETYGYDEQEIIGKDCNILWKQGALVNDPKSSQLAIVGWEVGFFHRRKDGSEFPVYITRSGVKDENGNEIALVVITRDISERMQIENDFRKESRELKIQNRLKKQLAVSTCRQLLPLITELKNAVSDMIADDSSEINQRLQEKLESTDKNIDRLRAVVNDFSDISQIDENSRVAEPAGHA